MGVFRWTSRFLLLVMLAPAFEPLAMAHALQPGAMHCMRQPVLVQTSGGRTSGHADRPAMPCHGAMAMAAHPESSEASFQPADENCCQNHCCCGATTSQWAHPACSQQSCLGLLIETERSAQNAVLQSSDIAGQDSARAPPRS
jgi:hypothetical protein